MNSLTGRSTTKSFVQTTGPQLALHENNFTKSCPSANLTEELLQAYNAGIVTISALFVCALFGNICVIVAVWQKRKKLTRMHMFILHLAFADIIVAMFLMLPELINRLTCEFQASDGMCRLMKYLQIVGMYGSTYVLVSAAMDRYLAIKYPLQTFKQSKKRVHLTILLAWLLSFFLSTPQLFLYELKLNSNGAEYCGMKDISITGKRIYVTWFFIAILALPFAMLAFFYGMIALIIYKNVKGKTKAAAPNRTLLDTRMKNNGEISLRASSVKMARRAKIKTVKMTFVIVILYAVCYTPYFTVILLGRWNLIRLDPISSQILYLAAPLNSCVNPWVYMGFSGHLLKELKNFCMCRKKTKEDQSQQSQRTFTSITNV